MARYAQHLGLVAGLLVRLWLLTAPPGPRSITQGNPFATQTTPAHPRVTLRVHKNLAKYAARASLLSRAAMAGQVNLTPVPSLVTKKLSYRRPAMRQTLFGTLAVIVLLATGYVGLDTWLTNRSVQAQLSDTPSVAGVTTASDDYQAQEGKDTTPLPKDSLADYAVAASLPRVLYIDKLYVAARILPMGVNKDNCVQAPINIFDAGWYNGSVKPGELGRSLSTDTHRLMGGACLDILRHWLLVTSYDLKKVMAPR